MNKKLKVGLAGTLLAASCLFNVANAGLIALYQYDDVNNLGLDSSAMGNNLSASGAPVSGAGVHSSGLSLDGASMLIAGNNYASSTLNGLPVGDSSYTIASWINPDEDSTRGGIIGYGNYGASNQVNALRTGDSYQELVQYWWGNDVTVNSEINLWEGWHHVAISYNSSTFTRQIYVDGINIYDQVNSGFNATANNFAIGKTFSSEYFKGQLDDTAIFDEALSSAQISTIKNGDFSAFAQNTHDVPEPSTLAVFGLGLMGLVSRRFKKQ